MSEAVVMDTDKVGIREFLEIQAQVMRKADLANGRKRDHYPYRSMEEFVLRHGYYMPFRALRDERWRGKPRQCFESAGRLAMRFHQRRGFIYVEGYAVSPRMFPVLHAWCLDADGYVVDPTWPDGVAYFGVPFQYEYCVRAWLEHKVFGLLDRWEADWPLLSGEHPVEEAILAPP